jgi:hypothetical protein
MSMQRDIENLAYAFTAEMFLLSPTPPQEMLSDKRNTWSKIC